LISWRLPLQEFLADNFSSFGAKLPLGGGGTIAGEQITINQGGRAGGEFAGVCALARAEAASAAGQQERFGVLQHQARVVGKIFDAFTGTILRELQKFRLGSARSCHAKSHAGISLGSFCTRFVRNFQGFQGLHDGMKTLRNQTQRLA